MVLVTEYKHRDKVFDHLRQLGTIKKIYGYSKRLLFDRWLKPLSKYCLLQLLDLVF